VTSPLTVIDSNLLMTTTSVTGTWIICGVGFPPTTEGVRVVNSTVTAIGCVIFGADNFGCFGGQHYARPGVVVESGTMRVGPGTLLRGGQTGSFPPTTDGYQVLNSQTGEVQYDDRGLIVRPPSSPAPVPIDLPATYHDWLVADEPFDVNVVGPPNGFALLLVGDWLPGQPPSAFGELAIDPATAVLVDLVPLNASIGLYEWMNLHCPSTAPVAHAFALQCLTLAPDGTFGLTLPSPLTVGWQHGAIP
jgi:hypothetical protein